MWGVAIALLIVGELLGFYMGMINDMKWRGVHIVIVLVGFVTIALFGAIYRLWPAMKEGSRAAAQFWLTIAGVIGVIVGSIHQTQSGAVVILAISSAVLIIGTLLLGWIFWERATA
jgi:hypothetical protein